MTDPQPHLKVVEEGDKPAPPEPAAERPKRVAIGLGIALAICAAGWALSAQNGRELAASLAATEAELAAAEARIGAYETHVSEARGLAGALVGELQGLGERLGELEAWLAAPPPEPLPEAPPEG